MKQAKRVKPAPTVVMQDLVDVDNALKDIAQLKRQVTEIDNEMEAQIDKLRAGRDRKAQKLLARIEELGNGIYGYSEYNRDELFAKQKSKELVFGTIGYRQSTKISITKKTLAMLKQLKLATAIIVQEKPDRKAMLRWSEKKLKSVGAKKVVEDNFWYEVKQENLTEAVAERK